MSKVYINRRLKRKEEEKRGNSLAGAIKKTGSETRGVRRQVSSCSADPHGPEQAAPAFDLNRFQSKQLFYKQHVIPYLKKKKNSKKKKKKVGKEGKKINMCSKLQPVCRQNNFCLKRWLFSPI